MVARNETDNRQELKSKLRELSLSHHQFLPVSENDTRTVLQTVQQDFFINNHANYSAKFSKHVGILDFECEESCKLSSLLQELGLQNRYLSKQVKQLAEPHESSYNDVMTTDFRNRAYALSW